MSSECKDCRTCLYSAARLQYGYCSGCDVDYNQHEPIATPQEYPADRIAALRARIAALEKCIAARDEAVDKNGCYSRICRCETCSAIRRADEEAGLHSAV